MVELPERCPECGKPTHREDDWWMCTSRTCPMGGLDEELDEPDVTEAQEWADYDPDC